jgi:hypothetical protein
VNAAFKRTDEKGALAVWGNIQWLSSINRPQRSMQHGTPAETKIVHTTENSPDKLNHL